MIIRHIKIDNFRGIGKFDWPIAKDQRFICLVGPGDSNKTNVLDAVGFALSSKWNVSIDDGDFLNCDVENPITIDVTFGEIPGELLTEAKYGHWMRGINDDGEIHDDPETSDMRVLTIRFTVDKTLEPRWMPYKQALEGTEKYFSSYDRAKLGVFRTDEQNVAHLKWNRGSALTKLSDGADTADLLASAYRSARKAVFEGVADELQAAATKAGVLVNESAAGAISHPRPGLDPATKSWSTSLVLHDAGVPMTRLGLGSRRLATVALQTADVGQHAVVMIDEIEHGLEPHRLTHLLDQLCKRAEGEEGQIFITSHSPLVIEALPCTDLNIVRSEASTTSVLRVPSELDGIKPSNPQATVRSGPSALLAKRVVICEGRTEVGLMRALAKHWASDAATEGSLALAGTTFSLGDGASTPIRAKCLADLGFETLVWVDDDLTGTNKTQFDAALAEAEEAGASVMKCDAGKSTENEIIDALPDELLAGLVNTAVDASEVPGFESAICDSISNALDVGALTGCDPVEWASQASIELSAVRQQLGKTVRSHNGGWFKSESRGELLGRWLVENRSKLNKGSRLVAMVQTIKSFSIPTEEQQLDSSPVDGH